MAKKVESKPKTDAEYFDYFQKKRWLMTKSIVTVSLISITLFGLVGYLLDLVLKTSPVVMIVMIVMSFPATQIAIHKIVKKKLHE
jgi:F0F1-type ATP synthase assembly protein I